MKEKIRKIAFQAGTETDVSDWSAAFCDRFAELLIAECIAQCNDGDSQHFIKEHFEID